MALLEDLRTIAANVQDQLPLMLKNETATIKVAVLPFVSALGYDTEDLSEVYPEYGILNMVAVDLAIMRGGEPIILVEAKRAGESLSNKHWLQLFQYFNADKARIGVLTNGIEYRFYTDLVTKNVMDGQPFLEINMRELDVQAVNALERFRKSKFDPDSVISLLKLEKLVKREYEAPSDDFVRYFAKQVHEGILWQEVVAEYAPLVRQAWQNLVRNEAAAVKPPPPPPGIGDDIPVYGSFEGHRFEAVMLRRVFANGFNGGSNFIRYAGQLTNAKSAMIAAIQSVAPDYQPEKSASGLRFWTVIDPANRLESPLYIMSKHVYITAEDEALRQRVLGRT